MEGRQNTLNYPSSPLKGEGIMGMGYGGNLIK